MGFSILWSGLHASHKCVHGRLQQRRPQRQSFAIPETVREPLCGALRTKEEEADQKGEKHKRKGDRGDGGWRREGWCAGKAEIRRCSEPMDGRGQRACALAGFEKKGAKIRKGVVNDTVQSGCSLCRNGAAGAKPMFRMGTLCQQTRPQDMSNPCVQGDSERACVCVYLGCAFACCSMTRWARKLHNTQQYVFIL